MFFSLTEVNVPCPKWVWVTSRQQIKFINYVTPKTMFLIDVDKRFLHQSFRQSFCLVMKADYFSTRCMKPTRLRAVLSIDTQRRLDIYSLFACNRMSVSSRLMKKPLQLLNPFSLTDVLLSYQSALLYHFSDCGIPPFV